MDLNKLIKEGMEELRATLCPKGKSKTADAIIESEMSEEDSDEEQCASATCAAPKSSRKRRNGGKSKMTNTKSTGKKKTEVRKGKQKDYTLGDAYVSYSESRVKPKHIQVPSSTVDAVMKKSAIGPGFEGLDAVPPYTVTERERLRENKEKRARTKGEKWFNMTAPTLTKELKNDLQVLKMRSALNPKHFYKNNDFQVLPKFFQVGSVVEAPADFYHSRIPKKQRKRTLVEELLADAEFQHYNKTHYRKIIEEQSKTTLKAHRHANRLKRKGKSRK